MLIACPEPECGAPAEILDYFTLSSTDGPHEMVRTQCVNLHIFTVPAERIPEESQ